MRQTIFITGTSSGLGKLTAKYFAEQGWNVAASMRSPERKSELKAYENIRLYQLDVTDVDGVNSAVKTAITDFGKIDVVVNNAGMAIYGALELATEQDIDRQFAVNTRGPINVIRAFLPHFRENQGGKFINISSLMGITTAAPVASLYNMSKFALEGLIEGLYYELKPLNIDLHLVEQAGSADNDFVKNITWSGHQDITAYKNITDKVRGIFEAGAKGVKDDPMTIVQVIYELATGKTNKFRNVVGQTSQGLMSLRSTLPIEEYLEKIAKNFS